ncbi:thymidylate synthase ThyX [Candidatus Methanoplasma termitum]|uniref:Flavin-dependent thymidylate synthase n=1 Tax=Candidatus Methanoplasma termitum TaxID=1577791 RepID=A0A0A7LC64_9ARCH|nr:FAD-dependent thymidylate synthase [Candidatus Methanoplasma termitum]AIZ55917.1 thymidylate synthase ThyX [Candidatus Methanoplasma termitum]MCL2334235.1 FAD-dependent thymidylate synthase [Candidatus Methanoplasma sp.]
MNVRLLAYTQGADIICAAAGRSCYSEKPSADLLEMKDPEKTLANIVGLGHHSVVEHAVFTFSVDGVSRALTHQLVRHRIASFSQQSQRYVPLKEPTYVIPGTIKADPDSLALYEEMMEKIWDAYRRLAETIPAEDARYLLPNGCTTNITITMNARELLHFFTMRCCERAQWEIREMAERMLALCKEVSPVIFKDAGPPCVRGPCPEGKLSCGHPRRPNKA